MLIILVKVSQYMNKEENNLKNKKGQVSTFDIEDVMSNVET